MGLYIVLIFLYVDGVILMAHTYKAMNWLLELMKEFCDRSVLKVNVAKAKMLICSKGPDQTFEFKGRVIENVMEFRYLSRDRDSLLVHVE